MTILERRLHRGRYSRGAVAIEYIFVLPFVIVLGITALAYMLFAITNTAFSHDTTRVAERAVRVSPPADVNNYCADIVKFATDVFDQDNPFYSLFLKNIVVEDMALVPAATNTVFRITRTGDFSFLGMAKLGFPSKLTATGQAVLSVRGAPSGCLGER